MLHRMRSVEGRTLAQQRHDQIVNEVGVRGAARVADLADLLGVSDMTVRRDLEILHEAGRVVKVHGGATSVASHVRDEPGFVVKSMRNVDEKVHIARAAAPRVVPGGTVGLTAGTTTWRLAAELTSVADLTVVTNSLQVVDVFTAHPRPDRTVILTGGVRTPSDALVGSIAVAALRTLHVDTLFAGVHGVSARTGCTTPNLLESDTNRAFVRAARQTIVLADHTKWDVTALSSFADLDEIDVFMTDDGIDPHAAEVLSSHIASVVIVPTASSNTRGVGT
jgi:DeoR/GlpR family transcriptional regulator of sugar metabolism